VVDRSHDTYESSLCEREREFSRHLASIRDLEIKTDKVGANE